MTKPKVILIAGPTGVGKTAASVLVAKKLDTEIISCDSMQIYKGMDIGTAKVTLEEAQGVVHHMTDIVSPMESFSVCDYVNMAAPIVEKLSLRGKSALVVGGTGLYADSLIKGITFSEEAPADADYRESLYRKAEEKGAEYIHALLRDIDPESAEAIHANNIKRVVRALEYHHTSGETISQHNKRTKNTPSPYESLRIYFTRERCRLYERIDKRVDTMLAMGLEDEVRGLINCGVDQNSTAMQALGYKEMADAILGRVSLDEAVQAIKQGSRRYAKRQLTWFKRDKEGIWLNLDEFDSCESVADECVRIIKERNMA